MGQAVLYCPPPVPVCRPQPAPWSYSPNFSPYPQPGCGCGCVPSCQPAPLFGPIIGVTDGSDAAAGQVGEFLKFSVTGSLASGSQTQTISAGVLPPGDWDAQAWFLPSVFGTSVTFQLSPAPVGASNGMVGNVWVGGTGAVEGIAINSQLTRFSLAVPTLLAFSLVTNMSAAGTFTFTVESRRRR